MKATHALALASTFTLGAAACTGDLGRERDEQAPGDIPVYGVNPGDGTTAGTEDPVAEGTVLDQRVIDYHEALRLASVKLRDITPTLEEIKTLEEASDARAAYEGFVDEYVDSARFTPRMIRFWRDTFRQGGGMLDTAPVFAARVVVEGRPYTDLLTATENTCPSYDGEAGAFVDGNCDNGVAEHAGVLTNPGTMAQFYGNMAFRRVRWVQEVFACQKFPAEYAENPVELGAGQYTAPWPLDSISNDPIDFHDASAVICANCHATMNHLAPLFANFDEDGQLQGTPQVMTPIAPDPVATERTHWLPAGEGTAWRAGVPVDSLPELGAVMAADPTVAACLTARMWNFAMSKEDIVTDLAVVPASVIENHIIQLTTTGDLKEVIRAMFKSEDFVSF